MNKSTRMLSLRRLLQGMNQSLSLSDIAKKLSCSEKTVRRDIHTLETDFDSPWTVHQNRVIWAKPKHQAIHLEGYWFSADELKALLALYHATSQMNQGVLKRELSQFKDKISQLLGHESNANTLANKIKIIPMASRIIDERLFNHLVQALQNNVQVDIAFWNRTTNLTQQRIISPQQLVRYRDRWILDAWCHQKHALRSFSLDAIQTITPLEIPCLMLDEAQLKQHFESSYGIFAGQANQQAILRFSPFIARWIQFNTHF